MKPYFISGHGEELTSTMTIPDNCIVIVKTHSGEIGYKTYFDDVCRLPYDVLQNPLDNMPKIIKAFGTVAVYTAGDTCPDFLYDLIACYHDPYDACETYGSGILDLERIIDDDDDEEVCRKHVPRTLDRFKDLYADLSYDGIIDMIARKYRNSVDPTESYVREVLDSVEAREEIMAIVADRNNLTMIDKCNMCIDYLISHKHIVRKQSELKGPAVYYNFLCRAKKGAKSLYGRPKKITYRTPFLAPPTFHIKNKNVKTTITKNRIAEAEIHRKRALRNYYSAEQKSQTRKRSTKRSSNSSRKRAQSKY